MSERPDVVVIGAGIVGLATSDALLRARPSLRVLVVDKEDRPAAHQSGHNSGVIHTGVYYRPESLKARTIKAGRRKLLDFCDAHGIPVSVVGKVIVAATDAERPTLHLLQSRADQNRIPAEIVGPARLAELEPHAAGVEALHVPDAATVDFSRVCEVLAERVGAAGGELRLRRRVIALREREDSVVLRSSGDELEARVVVNCAGLHSDVLAANGQGGRRSLRIVPFRGEYYRLSPRRAHLVRSMIYPVPDPRFPFLGVHFTRAVNGEVLAGPNAVLAFAREGYSWRTVDLRDMWDLLRFPGFRRLAAQHWRTALPEIRRSLSRHSFVDALRRLVPDISPTDLHPAPAGVRAQAVDSQGALIDDFVVRDSARVVHVLNAPSPAATASLEVGKWIASHTIERL